MHSTRTLTLLLVWTLLGACVNPTVTSTSVPRGLAGWVVLVAHWVLYVGIAIFVPGLDDCVEDLQIYPVVR